MKIFVIRQYDLLEPLTVTVYYANNTNVDLSNGLLSLRFRMATERGIYVIDEDAQLIAPNRFRYTWQPGDTDVAGSFRGVFIATFIEGTKPLTFPTRGYIPISIARQLPSE